PGDVEDPPAQTPEDFGDAMTDTLDFGLDVGQIAWQQNQLCIGDGQLLTDWLQNPSNLAGACKYTGTVPGAPATFPCNDIETFSMQIWGCLDTNSGYGASVKAFLLGHGLGTYLVVPAYSSSLTSNPVIDL